MVERPADRPGRQPTPADQPQCPQKPSDFCTDQPRPDKIMKKLSAVKCVVLTSSVRLHHTHNHIVQLLLLRSMGSDCPAVWRRGVSRLRFHTRRCCSTTGQLLHAPGAPDLPSAPEGESQLLHGGPGGTVEALQDCAEAALVQRPLVCSRRTVPPNARSTFLLVCSADGSHYATCHGDRTVRVFTRRGTLVRALGGHARSVWAAAFHPRDPATLASGCLGGVVRVWHEDTLIASWHASPPRPMPPPSGGSPLSPQRHPVSSLSFHPTDDTLAVACGSALYFWHTRSSPSSPSVRMVLTPSAAERVRFVKFSPCGDYLLTGVTNPPGLRVPHTPQLGLGAVPDLGISSETESDAPMETEPGAPCFMDPEPEAKCSMETALEAANALLKRQEAFRRSANAVRESEVSAGTAFRNVPGGVDLRDLMTLTAVGSLRPSSPPSTGEVSIGAASGPHPRASGSRNPTAPSGDPSGPWPHSFGGRDPSTPSGDPTLPNGASQEPQPPSFEFRDPTLLIGVPSDPSPRWGSDPSEPSLQGVLLNLLRTPVGCGAQPLPLRWPSDAVGPRYHGDPTLLGGGSGPPRTPPYTPFQPQLDPNSGVCLNFNCLARRFISDSASSNSSAASSTPSASPPLQRPGGPEDYPTYLKARLHYLNNPKGLKDYSKRPKDYFKGLQDYPERLKDDTKGLKDCPKGPKDCPRSLKNYPNYPGLKYRRKIFKNYPEAYKSCPGYPKEDGPVHTAGRTWDWTRGPQKSHMSSSPLASASSPVLRTPFLTPLPKETVWSLWPGCYALMCWMNDMKCGAWVFVKGSGVTKSVKLMFELMKGYQAPGGTWHQQFWRNGTVRSVWSGCYSLMCSIVNVVYIECGLSNENHLGKFVKMIVELLKGYQRYGRIWDQKFCLKETVRFMWPGCCELMSWIANMACKVCGLANVNAHGNLVESKGEVMNECHRYGRSWDQRFWRNMTLRSAWPGCCVVPCCVRYMTCYTMSFNSKPTEKRRPDFVFTVVFEFSKSYRKIFGFSRNVGVSADLWGMFFENSEPTFEIPSLVVVPVSRVPASPSSQSSTSPPSRPGSNASPPASPQARFSVSQLTHPSASHRASHTSGASLSASHPANHPENHPTYPPASSNTSHLSSHPSSHAASHSARSKPSDPSRDPASPNPSHPASDPSRDPATLPASPNPSALSRDPATLPASPNPSNPAIRPVRRKALRRQDAVDLADEDEFGFVGGNVDENNNVVGGEML